MICRRLSRLVVFFFSSRRRHTRLQGDWSSDVCSSDLAEILDSCHRYVRKPQRHGKRQRRLADALLIEKNSEPGRSDLIALDAGVEQRFTAGFDDEIVRATIPPLAELRATHA